MRNLSYQNEFDLHENETGCRTHFHMNGFARTWKWPIAFLLVGGMKVNILDWSETWKEIVFKVKK